MTDVHCHLIYGVDDGSRSLEESLELIKQMNKVGFDNIIITPHYIENSEYSSKNFEKEEKLNRIRQELIKQNINVNVYLGNEIFINNNIDKLVEKEEIETLNDTYFILVELPFHNEILNLEDELYNLKQQGYMPIIAHPERYSYFKDNYDKVDALKREGFLFQCNYVSIIGHYGKDAEKLIKYMLKHKYVDFLGTDIHNLDRTTFFDNYKKIDKLFNKYAGKDYYKKIKDNCDKLVK